MNHSTHGLQNELRLRSRWDRRLASWFEAHANLSAMLVVTVGLVVRLRSASGTFLNPDEALHFLIANQSSWRLACHASLTNAHPPLLTLVLYFWRGVGTSEFVLRLPSVIAGTAFCWIFFEWLRRVLGPVTGVVGLILVTFLPPVIELATEVRQYSLLLFFMAGALYLMERALAEDSPAMMLLSAISLCLGLLSHYSAILFAAAVGVYCLLRLIARPSAKLGAAWISGQAGAAGLVAFLYITHISKLTGSYAAGTVNGWLANSFFRPGHDNPFFFVIGRSGGVFQYVFGQLAVGDVAFLAFIVGLVLLWRENFSFAGAKIAGWRLATLLAFPFVAGAGAAIVRIYPYGGTRHSAYLIMFAVAGVSFLLAKLAKQEWRRGAAIAILVVGFCNAFGQPHRPYMIREGQSRVQMTQAMEFVQSQIPQSDLIFVDYQTRLLLGYYLCAQQPVSFSARVGVLEELQCGGHGVIAAGPDLYVLTAENFLPRWNELARTHPLRPGQALWVMQAGWEVGLSQELGSRFPEFAELKPRPFGRNITVFKVTVGQPMSRAVVQSN